MHPYMDVVWIYMGNRQGYVQINNSVPVCQKLFEYTAKKNLH